VPPAQWYNGDPLQGDDDQPAGTTYVSMTNQLLGGVRLRQLRVRNGTCVPPDVLKGPAYTHGGVFVDGEIVRTDYELSPVWNDSAYNVNYCYAEYSEENADRSAFAGEKWRWLSAFDDRGLQRRFKHIYEFSEANETQSFWSWGQLGLYDGTGFTVTLPSDPALSIFSGPTIVAGGAAVEKVCNASCTLQQLKEDRWLGPETRAVFVDFCLYNEEINHHMSVNVIFEQPPTGGIIVTYNFRPVQLHMYVGDHGMRQLALELLLCAFAFYYTGQEIMELYQVMERDAPADTVGRADVPPPVLVGQPCH
jgi:hypothetical protein